MTEALVSCAIGRFEYALRAGDIVAVMRAEKMRAPGPCEAGMGVVTVGGERVSVHPLSEVVGLPPAPEAGGHRDRHIVVVRGAQGPVGWLVDRVARTHVLTQAQVLPLPPLLGPRAARSFAGVLSDGDLTVLLLAATPVVPHAAVPSPATAAAPSTPGRRVANAAPPLVVTFTSAALPDCGASRYAVSARRVGGVESNLDIAAVPGSEPPVIGVGVWHGGVLPVIDMQNSAQDLAPRRLLILRGGGRTAGMPVAIPIDTETALWQPTDDNPAITAVPSGAGALPSFVAGLFEIRGQTVALIDPDLLLADSHEPRPAGTTPDGSTCAAAGRLSGPWTLENRRTIA